MPMHRIRQKILKFYFFCADPSRSKSDALEYAVAGILDAFDLAKECLEDNHVPESENIVWAETLRVPAPRPLQAIFHRELRSKYPECNFDSNAITFGEQHLPDDIELKKKLLGVFQKKYSDIASSLLEKKIPPVEENPSPRVDGVHETTRQEHINSVAQREIAILQNEDWLLNEDDSDF